VLARKAGEDTFLHGVTVHLFELFIIIVTL